MRTAHRECQAKHDLGRAEIVALVKAATHDPSTIASLQDASGVIAVQHHIAESDVRSLIIAGWERAVDGVLADGVLTEEEEANLAQIRERLGFSRDELDRSGAYTKVVQGAILRDLMHGVVPQRFTVTGQLPFNLQKGEKVVWIFHDVKYYQQKTRRHFQGGSSGFSIRVARGVYYRTGAFRGHPVETKEDVLVGTGLLAFTDKHLYFAGRAKSFRIAYKKVVSFEPFSDGIGVHRDAASAKPQLFITGDGWFAYNLAMNLSQL
ncbi:MAG TPA: hypothetical protein DCM14_04995 [Clostridiales bacterium UBA8153]|nr:hypothetical protein [Clostridiales bacterium UBA8153]